MALNSNSFLEAYILGRRERRQEEETLFRHTQDKERLKIQQDEEKRQEAARKDAVKHWEDLIKFQRERLQFDRDKEVSDADFKRLQGRKIELDMKKLGFEMLAKGEMAGQFTEADPETIHRGMDELFNTSQGNRYGIMATLLGSGLAPDTLAMTPRTSVRPYEKKDIEIAPGVILPKDQWQLPWEAGQGKAQLEGPLEEKKAQNSVVRMLLNQFASEGVRSRLQEDAQKHQEKMEDIRNKNIIGRANLTNEQRIEARKQALEDKKEFAEFNATLRKNTGKSGAGVTRENKLSAFKAMVADHERVLKLGEETNWEGQDWSNRLPWSMSIKDMFDVRDPKVTRYLTVLGSVNADRYHSAYGSVLSKGELQRAEQYITEPWIGPETARTRLKEAIEFYKTRIKYLQEGGDPTVDTGTEGWTASPGSGRIGGPNRIPLAPPKPESGGEDRVRLRYGIPKKR